MRKTGNVKNFKGPLKSMHIFFETLQSGGKKMECHCVGLGNQCLRDRRQILLLIFTHFWPMHPFYTLWKHQKTFGFMEFSGGIKWEQWPEID